MNSYLFLGVALFAYMVGAFIISLLKRRNDIADIAWGLGFVLISWLSFYLSEQHERGLFVNLLVTIWGIRLSWHIFWRNSGKPEDFRYEQWRKAWKNFYVRSFFQVYMLQGLFLFITLFPVLFIHQSEFNGFIWWDAFGALIWIIGFYFESLGDYQLKKFKTIPANKGKIMTEGLWRYTRHPNYFGEAVQWWGIFMMVVSLPGGWVTIIGPIAITYLLRYVSGVPMLEKKYEGNADFEVYKNKTSAFIPLLPK